MDEYTVDYLKLEDGSSPFINWLNSIDTQIKNRIISRIARLHHGNFGDCKKLSGDISELRFKFGSGYRVYYSIINKVIIILISGGDKSTQKKDIEKAQQLLKQWRQVNGL